MEETIFQKIIKGEIPADKVYEDEDVLAFLDIRPTNKGHTLVIPKDSVRDIHELGNDSAGKLMRAIVKVANAVKKVTGAPGINVVSNNGFEAGQVVFHLHFHIIPRFNKDEVASIPRTSYDSDTERTEIAEAIAGAVE